MRINQSEYLLEKFKSKIKVEKRTPLREKKRDGLILWSDYTFIVVLRYY
jgi:hypothetical protein